MMFVHRLHASMTIKATQSDQQERDRPERLWLPSGLNFFNFVFISVLFFNWTPFIDICSEHSLPVIFLIVVFEFEFLCPICFTSLSTSGWIPQAKHCLKSWKDRSFESVGHLLCQRKSWQIPISPKDLVIIWDSNFLARFRLDIRADIYLWKTGVKLTLNEWMNILLNDTGFPLMGANRHSECHIHGHSERLLK